MTRGLNRTAVAVAALVLGAASAPALAHLTIIPTFDSSITGSPYSGTIESEINNALSFYDNSLANPITVNIYFQSTTNVSYLGESESMMYSEAYATYTGLLANDASVDPVARTAYDNLHYGNDSNGSVPILATSANLRALGMTNTPGGLTSGAVTGGNYDGIISLNATGLTGFNGANSGAYTASGVIQHEVDEVLGIGGPGSTLQIGGSNPPRAYGSMDLYRYSGSHTPSYTTSPTASSYFSINGGVTNLVNFNQNPDQASGVIGDFSDWGGNPGYVQQAFTPAGSTANVSLTSPEGIALQAVGYDPLSGGSPAGGGWRMALLENARALPILSQSKALYSLASPVPEPSPLVLLALSALALCFRKQRPADRNA